ncbi:MAG: hydantoinase B/oxoprolinase family protein [Conexibacter sp.]
MPAAEATAKETEFELEILRHKLASLVEEMGVVLEKSARSAAIGEGRDAATAIGDRHGGIVAIDNPVQLGSIACTAADVLAYFKFDMKDGDVVFTSDPYRGGTHVQDVTLVAPYAVDNSILLYLVVRGHVADVGGRYTGSYDPAARELWSEGVPITPVRIHRHGRLVSDIFTTIMLNTRKESEVRQDVDAMLTALQLGRRRVDEIVGSFGLDVVRRGLAYAQDYAERRTRAEIAGWQDGSYGAQSSVEHDAIGGGPVTVRLEAEVAGEELLLDFSASDAQRESFVNSSLGATTSFAALPLLSLLGPDVPANSGVLRPVVLRCAPGTVVNPERPAAVGWVSHCGAQVAEATATALRAATDDRVAPPSTAGMLLLSHPADDAHAVSDFGQWVIGGASATPAHDGWGRPAPASRGAIPSVETWESTSDVRVERIELVEDSAGAGLHRGAPATEVVLSGPADRTMTLVVAGREIPTDGVAGGNPGATAQLTLERGAEARPAPSALVDEHVAEPTLRIRAAAGGGYGPARERPAAAVLADVLDGLVSRAAAERDYGVALDAAGAIDEQRTAELRLGTDRNPDVEGRQS